MPDAATTEAATLTGRAALGYRVLALVSAAHVAVGISGGVHRPPGALAIACAAGVVCYAIAWGWMLFPRFGKAWVIVVDLHSLVLAAVIGHLGRIEDARNLLGALLPCACIALLAPRADPGGERIIRIGFLLLAAAATAQYISDWTLAAFHRLGGTIAVVAPLAFIAATARGERALKSDLIWAPVMASWVASWLNSSAGRHQLSCTITGFGAVFHPDFREWLSPFTDPMRVYDLSGISFRGRTFSQLVEDIYYARFDVTPPALLAGLAAMLTLSRRPLVRWSLFAVWLAACAFAYLSILDLGGPARYASQLLVSAVFGFLAVRVRLQDSPADKAVSALTLLVIAFPALIAEAGGLLYKARETLYVRRPRTVPSSQYLVLANLFDRHYRWQKSRKNSDPRDFLREFHQEADELVLELHDVRRVVVEGYNAVHGAARAIAVLLPRNSGIVDARPTWPSNLHTAVSAMHFICSGRYTLGAPTGVATVESFLENVLAPDAAPVSRDELEELDRQLGRILTASRTARYVHEDLRADRKVFPWPARLFAAEFRQSVTPPPMDSATLNFAAMRWQVRACLFGIRNQRPPASAQELTAAFPADDHETVNLGGVEYDVCQRLSLSQDANGAWLLEIATLPGDGVEVAAKRKFAIPLPGPPAP